MANVAERRRKEQAKAKALKKLAMAEPGYESRYHTRKQARKRGEPMADRSGERAPWWSSNVGIMASSTALRTPAEAPPTP